jgi:hypothetical protein
MDWFTNFLPLVTFIIGFALGVLKPKEDNTPKAPPIKCAGCKCEYSFTANDVKCKQNIPYVECPICGTKHFFSNEQHKENQQSAS